MLLEPSRDRCKNLATDGLFSSISVKKSAFFELDFKPKVPCLFRKFLQLLLVLPEVFDAFPGPSRDFYTILAPDGLFSSLSLKKVHFFT